MIRERNASALEPWLKEAIESGVLVLRTFAKGIKRDQAAIQAALTYEWSQGQVGRFIVSSCSNANPMDEPDLVCYAIVSLRGLLELSTEDDTDPQKRDSYSCTCPYDGVCRVPRVMFTVERWSPR